MRARHLICMTFAALTLLPASDRVWGQEVGQEAGSGMSASEARRQARLFDGHTVRMGETAFSIARGYAISPQILAADNPGIDLTRIRAGQVLLIRKRERGRTDARQVAVEWEKMIAGNIPTGAGAVRDTIRVTWPPLDTLRGVDIYRREAGREGGPGDFSGGGTPDIALMLPLGTGGNQAGKDFTDFYKGFLLGLESLKAQGRSASVTLYNSEHSADKVRDIVVSADFLRTDLIIGPVFEEEMEPAVEFGGMFGVPVVSPLAALRRLDSEALWQMAPDAGSKYDKLRPMLEGDVNIITVSSGAADDAEFAGEMEAELRGRAHSRFTVGGGGDIVPLIDWDRPNVLVVLAAGELSVNMSLATISSSYSNASARSNRRADITVIGSSKWANFGGTSLDQNLLFKLNVRFVTNYHIDRSNALAHLFETRYTEVYGDLPSKSAFRGYDTAAIFVGALFERGFSLADRIGRVEAAPLGTPYRFVQTDGYCRHVNDQWTLVSFSGDYSITAR